MPNGTHEALFRPWGVLVAADEIKYGNRYQNLDAGRCLLHTAGGAFGQESQGQESRLTLEDTWAEFAELEHSFQPTPSPLRGLVRTAEGEEAENEGSVLGAFGVW